MIYPVWENALWQRQFPWSRVMGVQACPLPTAVLSAQTGFPSYYYDDYTEHMEEIMDQWEKMDFRPNGIYTGFLAGMIRRKWLWNL